MDDFETHHFYSECADAHDIFEQAENEALHFLSGVFVLAEDEDPAVCRDAYIHAAQTHGFYVVANERVWVAVNLHTMFVLSVTDLDSILAVNVEGRAEDLGKATVLSSDGTNAGLEAVLAQTYGQNGSRFYTNGGQVHLLV